MTADPAHRDSCVVGVDFGTLSGRAVVVRVSDGTELGAAVHDYRHGVILVTFVLTRALPGDPAVYFAGPAATQQAIAEIRHSLGLEREAADLNHLRSDRLE